MVYFTETCSGSSQGMDFAKKQLEKHGWTKGKGLGRDESGMANAIKVGVKKDTLGVGFDVGKEFTHHWWDHMFNKTASNIVVEHSETGINVKKKEDAVTKPKKFYRVKGQDLYYGRFVKASKASCSEVGTTEDHAPTKISDEQLLKACGGRTGHKSARHGHQLSGKLRRVAEQETGTSISDDESITVQHNLQDESGERLRKNKKKMKNCKVYVAGSRCKDDLDISAPINSDMSDTANTTKLVSAEHDLSCPELILISSSNGENDRRNKKKRKRKGTVILGNSEIEEVDSMLFEKGESKEIEESESKRKQRKLKKSKDSVEMVERKCDVEVKGIRIVCNKDSDVDEDEVLMKQRAKKMKKVNRKRKKGCKNILKDERIMKGEVEVRECAKKLSKVNLDENEALIKQNGKKTKKVKRKKETRMRKNTKDDETVVKRDGKMRNKGKKKKKARNGT